MSSGLNFAPNSTNNLKPWCNGTIQDKNIQNHKRNTNMRNCNKRNTNMRNCNKGNTNMRNCNKQFKYTYEKLQ